MSSCNAHPVKTLQRQDDALGPSELVSLLGLSFAIIIQTGPLTRQMTEGLYQDKDDRV